MQQAGKEQNHRLDIVEINFEEVKNCFYASDDKEKVIRTVQALQWRLTKYRNVSKK